MAGTDKNKALIAEGPAIILAEPQLGENIGMVARAMANFGLADLRLVRPREGWPNAKAASAASNANHVIAATRVFDTLEAAIGDLNYCVATTARARDGFKPVFGPVEASRDLRRRHETGERIGILFGRERTGLKNEEVDLADAIVTFPVNPAYASLNIAQAVLLMSYEWLKSGLGTEAATPFSGPARQPARKDMLVKLFDQLEQALEARNYFRSANKKPKMISNLRAVLTRPEFSQSEIDVLRGVVRSLDGFMRRDGQMRLGGDAPGDAAGDAGGEREAVARGDD
ncbi:RNA methyltransferase [Pseudohoeflea coraliihabitans]|uniref:tRNA (cytidine/uridine-2'-O-)-methyltransferase TrmJ n=1 Tax=Pseudohoeflea coraliihabitans TaxID=2860393 RepID=A0ABS6WSQ1_9HYPH|nr:RNA methyltransferase [Pseudohoeflea sp. DP4N28-3]MBW3098084.1 RNA methyltransferase [Pseudohoeflea sp. DP4N28-3]